MKFGISQIQGSDRDWVIDAHADHYARVERFDGTFPIAVAAAFDACLAAPEGIGWIARTDGRRCGSLLLTPLGRDALQIRLFLVVEDARGRGLGRRLLTTARDEGRARGARRLTVATFAEHRDACALYSAFGFTLDSRAPARAFGRDLTLQTWSYPLAIAESDR
ncbi:GNAT family N-acetyltransferase [Maribius pontilimi]|uniref:GNAT family N-acetyltransferase n=1 Tax=Palleronia pontilimi TaxID=1964209 RepID=A0A934IAI3_9RHOB|nr:GNAT family N-acetyltransferase [Palleronia pontilimi]